MVMVIGEISTWHLLEITAQEFSCSCFVPQDLTQGLLQPLAIGLSLILALKLELIQTQMTQKPVIRAEVTEVYARVKNVNSKCVERRKCRNFDLPLGGNCS